MSSSNEDPTPNVSEPAPDAPEATQSPPREDPSPAPTEFKPLWNNLVSMFGIFLVIIGLLGMLTFALFSAVSRDSNPYVDIVGYLVVPSILMTGVLIIPLGILFKSWWLRRRDPDQRMIFRFPRIDLNDPKQRRAAKVVLIGTFILLPVVAVSSYHGYHYTDSANFCADACHAVMKPQATTYEHSAHARVPCAECHIGAGAGWFVRSKLSGTRQVLAMWQESYPRPIPPAIHQLRPARETCEHCHWPKKFFGAQLREIAHFASDETNTRREIDMLLKTGGGDETTGRAMGIHKHMALAGHVTYIAVDERLQQIPWVAFTDLSGKRLIYRSDGLPTSDPRPEGEERTLDCMDCHNRPAHKFRSPQEAMNIYLDIGRIDTTLPYIKREGTKALVESYPDLETAHARIGATLIEFYQTNYPEIWRTRTASVNGAIDMIRDIYTQNTFPDMKVDWKTYPDNIGHMISSGCFRCHDGSHVNQEGERLSHACNVCHTFLNPVDSGSDTPMVQAGEFKHSYDLRGSHQNLGCSTCHSGGISPVPRCEGCHTEIAQFRAGKTEAFKAFNIAADPMVEKVGCEDCHDLDEPTDIETIDTMCMDCHEDEEERFEGMLASWKTENDDAMTKAILSADGQSVMHVDTLRRVGPFHNFEAARKILRGEKGEPKP